MRNLLFFFSILCTLSCGYPDVVYEPDPNFPLDTNLIKVIELPKKVSETSGLAIIDGTLWTHNDSGDYAYLYQISAKKKKVIKKVFVENCGDFDWEGITQDSANLYVGNFGNNGGHRKDLEIYSIDKQDLFKKSPIQAKDKIEFHYPSQSNFNLGAYQHNYDCEAMLAHGDSLYLFSKNYLDYKCGLYRLPKTGGKYAAHWVDTFNTQGLITAAAFSANQKYVVLLGYGLTGSSPRVFEPFVWILQDYIGNNYFSGKKQRINLPYPLQAEAICYLDEDRFYISNEEQGRNKQALYIFDAGPYLERGGEVLKEEH